MGVTAIQSHPLREYYLATGSYDEYAYIWDTRQIKSPLMQYHTNGGGLWRLKWHPSDPDRLVAAAMHNGFHALRCKEDHLVAEAIYQDHESLAYGVDYVGVDEDGCDLMGSCSFYDHAFHLWRFKSNRA
jgi:diphthamide biosynthesis protein 7